MAASFSTLQSSQPVNGNKDVIYTHSVFIHSFRIFNIHVVATTISTMFTMVRHPPSEDIRLLNDTSARDVTSADPNLSTK